MIPELLSHFSLDRRRRHTARIRRRCEKDDRQLRPYQLEHLRNFDDLVGWRGLDVLEIGGDLAGQVSAGMMSLGAKSVTSINLDPEFDTALEVAEGVKRLFMDARELSLPDNSFDAVFGIALLEHLHGLDQILSELNRVLKPGGRVYLNGGPLWNSARGHHLVVSGPTGRYFHFNFDNPLPNWYHLLKDQEELLAWLLSEGINEEDAGAIVDYTYGSPLINRASWQSMVASCEESPMEVVRYDFTEGVRPAPELEQALVQKLNCDPEDLSRAAINLLLRKRA